MRLDDQVKALPQEPGVYLFRDRMGKPLYVGKAINLRNRVASYFRRSSNLGPKTRLLISQIQKIDHFRTASEIEALLLEADLIKRLKPRFNRRLRDDKAYPLIKITAEKFPRVTLSRRKDEKATYYGPFPYGNIRRVLKVIREIFPYRDCSASKFNRYKKLGHGCLFHDLKLCPAPCIEKITEKDYQQHIRKLKNFLRGRGKETITALNDEMEEASQRLDFEKARKLKDKIVRLRYIRQKVKTPPVTELDINLPEDQRERELQELAQALNLPRRPTRIEAYDISDIQGNLATGSMVVFKDGEPERSHYRRFRIRLGVEPDDVGMIKEVLKRRFSRHHATSITPDASFSARPDLLLIDGGKGQLNAAISVLRELHLKIPITSLAKKEEVIYFYDQVGFKERCGSVFISGPLHLPRDSKALQLLQRIRDEAHRFALSYHRKLRRRYLLSPSL